jgi:hypothetical protein
LITLGQAQDGIALITQGLAELRPAGGVLTMPLHFTWLAEAHAMLGQSDEERNCLVEDAGQTQRSVARSYNVSQATISRLAAL